MATERDEILEFVGSEKELELEAFRMASGGDANWRVARDESLRAKLLELFCRWLEAQDLTKKDLAQIAEIQPLRFRRPGWGFPPGGGVRISVAVAPPGPHSG